MKQLFAALLVLSVCASAIAQEDDDAPPRPAPPAAEKKADAPSKDAARDQIVTTTHTVTINGQVIAYTARAGTMIMKDDDGTPRASIFFVAYTKDGADAAKRPVTYTFNGGPGSSSVWLHMGAFGPKRVVYADDDGHAARPPYRTVDNDFSLLDVTDLVFIDPVTTGYSRAIPFKDAGKFHGVEADVRSVGDFIRLWTSRNGRWASPKFLAGESYGTTRAAGLSGYLQGEGMYVNGIALISSILNFGTARFDSGNDLPYILFLPTYSAIAWYHRKLPAELQSMTIEQLTSAAEQFALGDYTSALMRGDALPEAERKAIAQKVARFTGLTADYVDRANLRVQIDRFDKELLRDQRRTVGRLDGRFTGIDRDAAGEDTEFDPSYSAIMGEYTAVMNDYVRRELKYETDQPYEILTGKVRPWSYDKAQNRYVDVGETLRGAMSQNPYLKVFVGNGYYDLATPFAATRYTFNRMQLDPEVRKNLSMDYFEAGHMMYIDKRQHARLSAAIRTFIKGAY
ncbi:MAG: peptidase serine carboxypeptidase [Acidobacteria bacterium]|nr:peptidase serine carboxypeptidase [Acidobacteriota bacterium]